MSDHNLSAPSLSATAPPVVNASLLAPVGSTSTEPATLRLILGYLATFLVAFVGAGLALRFGVEQLVLKHKLGQRDAAPGHLQSAETKTAHYLAHASEYDLVFLGDSRTLCGIDPLVIDRNLHTRSVNLAHWAHWIDTQYPNFRILASHIPKGTRVVWSVGHLVFQPIHAATNMSYPVGLTNVPQYLAWGYPPQRFLDNIATSIPGLDLFARREQLRAGVDARLNSPLFARRMPSGAVQQHSDEFIAVQNQWTQDPSVAQIDGVVDGNNITSAAVWMRAGNYRRIEFDHAFFRRKQAEDERDEVREITTAEFEAYPPLWRTFLGILDLFKASQVELVVNEIHEAPYKYKIAKNERLYREFMAKVQLEVERRGFRYIRADFAALTNEDYFDYDHLNDVGANKYSALLANLLGPAK
jgi:hypothetical protein